MYGVYGRSNPYLPYYQVWGEWPYDNFRAKTGEHLARLAEGRIETITQNGEAAMVVMSPGRYDFLVHAAERGHVWKAALVDPDLIDTPDTNRRVRVRRLRVTKGSG